MFRLIQLVLLIGFSGLVMAQDTKAGARPARPTPPTRDPKTPGYVKAKELPDGEGAAGGCGWELHHRADASSRTGDDGAGRRAARQGVEFTMESKDSKFYPGIARDVFGTADPNNPKTLIVESTRQGLSAHDHGLRPAQYKHGHEGTVHRHARRTGPDSRLLLPHVLDNLIAQKRVPAMIAISIQNGGGDAQGSERGLEYDTMSGKFAEFIESGGAAGGGEECNVKLTRKDPMAARPWAAARARRGVHDGLVSPRVVPPRHQLLRHLS